MGFWILVLLVVLLIAALPSYPYSRGWGYWGAGLIALLILIWFFALWAGWLVFAWPWVAMPAAT